MIQDAQKLTKRNTFGTLIAVVPLLITFPQFQRQFVQSIMRPCIKRSRAALSTATK